MQSTYRSGFTLLETQMALAILAVGASGLIGAMVVSGNAVHDARERTQALSQAREQLDMARSTPLPELLQALTGSPDESVLAGGGEVVTRFEVPSLRALDAEPPVPVGMVRLYGLDTDTTTVGGNMIGIDVVCEWRGPTGTLRKVQLTGMRRR